jgi:hypothetical protein
LDGKLGALAKEIAEETTKDLQDTINENENVDDVFKNLIKDPTRLMKLIKSIGTKLDDKFKSGELKESELLEEASEMLNKMKKVPGMKNIDELLKKMGMPGGVGKMGGGKIDLGAMKNNLNVNLKNAKMRERMLKKLQDKKDQQKKQVENIINNAVISDDKFTTGEIVEKSKAVKEKTNKKKKKNKNKNKKK